MVRLGERAGAILRDGQRGLAGAGDRRIDGVQVSRRRCSRQRATARGTKSRR